MILPRIFLAGQAVPDWLAEVVDTDEVGRVEFASPTAVWVYEETFRVRSVVCGSTMKTVGYTKGRIQLKRPDGRIGKAHINDEPILGQFDVFLILVTGAINMVGYFGV